jgi:hypothetical protein
MLVVEITNDESKPIYEGVGITFGNYDYVVKVKGNVISSGRVENQPRKHFSLLLAAIAEDAKMCEFNRVAGRD